MIKIAIVDDNRYHIEDVKVLLGEFIKDIKYTVHEYTDAHTFLKDAPEKAFDIAFLDVVLSRENEGIEAAVILNEKSPETNIIFVSAHPEYFKDVYKAEHSYFLVKDFEKERFRDAIEKALKNVQNSCLFLHIHNDIHKILLSEVVFFESYSKHTIVHITDGTKKEYNVDMRKVESQIPGGVFIRTHQGFIVNMNYIKNYSRQKVTVLDGTDIPISRSYVNSVREKLAFFIGGAL